MVSDESDESKEKKPGEVSKEGVETPPEGVTPEEPSEQLPGEPETPEEEPPGEPETPEQEPPPEPEIPEEIPPEAPPEEGPPPQEMPPEAPPEEAPPAAPEIPSEAPPEEVFPEETPEPPTELPEVTPSEERGLDISSEWELDIFKRPISDSEFYYLLSRWPYLDICTTGSVHLAPKRIIRAPKSGWAIIDYGDRLCAAPGRTMYGDYHTEKPEAWEEKGGEEGGDEGSGTVVMQMVNTAEAMIALANERWPGVKVLDGFYGMIRAAWIAAEGYRLEFEGFEPSPEDYVVKNWVEKLCGANKDKVPRPM